MNSRTLCVFFLAATLGLTSANAAITFTVSFTAQAQSDLSPAEQALFTDAIQFWDDIIDGHRDGINRAWNLSVDTFSTAASGGSITLGSAGPGSVAFSQPVAGLALDVTWNSNRFIYSTSGSSSFNVHPDAGALQAATIRHEIGHALGIGTLWEDNGLYTDGVVNPNREGSGSPGQFNGPAALAAFQAEFDPGASFVPVELNGSGGTAHGHWNEADSALFGDAGSAIIAISGPGTGLSMDDELMTGSLSSPNWISNTTIASLYDLGFTLHPVPTPEPGTIAFLGMVLLLGMRRRR